MLDNWKGRCALAGALLAILTPVASAQVTGGDLTGTVFDASGATVANAEIVATNEATKVEGKTASSASGQYRLTNLPAGSYTLTVTAPGFTKSEMQSVNIDLNKVATINVSLQVSSATTTVDVTEAATALDTSTAQIQSTYEARQLSDLPVQTGAGYSGILNLSLLNPGVATSGSVGVGWGPSVGGQRPRNNNFTLEGVNINSKASTGPVVSVPNDAVSEFTVLQNQFSPEFGRSSGGQFNIAVRSGSNEIHGRLYEYFQNRNLNAADNLSAISGTDLHPRYDSNRFGGQIGGPIRQNQLFYFANFEYNAVGYASIPGLIYAPTSTAYSELAALPGINQTNLQVLEQYVPGQATAIPGVSTTVGGLTVPLGQYSVSGPNYQNYANGVGAIDYAISERDNLRGRFIYNKFDATDSFAQLPAFYTISPVRSYAVAINEYHNFSPTLINELRLGYNRQNQSFPAGNFQFPGLDSFPNIMINELYLQLGPDPSAPQTGVQNYYQGVDNINWTWKNHSFKFGGEFQKAIAPQSYTQRVRGDYEWNTLEGYLTDTVPDYAAQRSLGNPIYYGDQIFAAGFFNDIWKLRPNLTLNIGLRYEYQTVPYSMRLQRLNAISSVPGLISFSEPTAPKDNFMPRVGLAWSPGNSGKTAIRAGFGINYDQIYDNIGLLSLPPQLQQTIDVTGSSGTGFLANGGLPPNVQTGGLSAADARAGTSGYIPNMRRPKSIQWNFGIEHTFAKDYTFELRYLGTRGINLPVQTQLNRIALYNQSNSLPLFFTRPSQVELDALPNALIPDYSPTMSTDPVWAAAGFNSAAITAYMPIGNSTYHGLATQVSRRFSNGLNFSVAYTLSHNIDDSTADVASTFTTPRRPQDFRNMRAERASSALDHRHRLTASLLYDLPFFKGRQNWLLKNVVGNWEIAPIYTYQSGTLYTVQSSADADLNGDAAADRAIFNPLGVGSTGSGVTALTNTAGATVGYLADDPTARYIAAAPGLVGNLGRNTLQLNPINDVDLTLMKRFNISERWAFELAGRAFNLFNHPQYTGGYLNEVAPVSSGLAVPSVLNFTTPGYGVFNRPDQVFWSNPRTLQITAKIIF